MSKKAERKNEQYPIELPTRSNISKNSPIVDVLDSEVFPLETGIRHHSGVHKNDISEVVATEVHPNDLSGF